jgi:hypothetical protein
MLPFAAGLAKEGIFALAVLKAAATIGTRTCASSLSVALGL